ncbi:MAG: T4 RnlA family RNA ligase [Aggregatilineales bacterium]
MDKSGAIREIRSIEDIQQLAIAGLRDWKFYGDVVVRSEGDLLIFNYTELAQYKAEWNFFERVSRGLIINARTGEIVARPFDKFYNWLEGGRRASGHIVTVTEKLDGSLGVLFRTPNGYRITTRGSFSSKQAEWATRFLNAHFDLSDLPEELTLLFEIIYPDNRVIVNYQAREDLVLLAARNRFTGDYLPFFPDIYDMAQRYGFTLPQVYQFNNLTQIIEKTGTLDASEEGYVVEFSDGTRFKFKGDRYLELQRLVTGLTYKNVLRAMSAHSLDEILKLIPDEFLIQTKAWIQEIQIAVATTKAAITAAMAEAPNGSRKDFAQWVQADHKDLAPYLFAALDNFDIEALIYKNLLAHASERVEPSRDNADVG